MNKERVYENAEKMIRKNQLTNEEEIKNYLTDLKNRGIITKAQADSMVEDLCGELNCGVTSSATGTRTPKTMEYAYSNVSAGFSKTGMLVLIAMSVPVLIATLVLLRG